MAELNKKK